MNQWYPLFGFLTFNAIVIAANLWAIRTLEREREAAAKNPPTAAPGSHSRSAE
jgi:hypothetical protein